MPRFFAGFAVFFMYRWTNGLSRRENPKADKNRSILFGLIPQLVGLDSRRQRDFGVGLITAVPVGRGVQNRLIPSRLPSIGRLSFSKLKEPLQLAKRCSAVNRQLPWRIVGGFR